MNGILVVDKPTGLSSAATVDKVKRALKSDRAGHGGTLDPIATGVLPVCLGAATKLAGYLLADDKAYDADGLLGVETDTLDRTGKTLVERPVDVTREAFEAAIARRIGEQTQVPPMFSAIKQGGVRMYERARLGEEVERAPRQIRIDRLEVLMFEPPHFRIAIACSKGTYVRSVLADLGTDLGCGAHMTELRRTLCGRFSIAQAVTLEQSATSDVFPHLIAMIDATDLPRVVVDEPVFPMIRNGVQLPVASLTTENHERFQLVDGQGKLHAIVHVEDARIIYERVFREA